jgi:outer membrane cobalamin receptor
MKRSLTLGVVLLALLCLALHCPAFAANLGLVDGTIRDYSGPVANAHVLLLRGDRRVDDHVTDAEGHFEFEQVPFGDYRVSVTWQGRTQFEDIHVASGEVVQVEIRLAAAAEEIVVTASRARAPAPSKVPSSTSTIDRRELKNLPRGESVTVNEILATQPGFVYDAMGNLFARGNHANIQYQIDGVPLPDSVSGLFGGFLSPKFVENMEVVTGGFDAEYGERLAAVVNLNSRRATEEGEGEMEVAGGSYQTLNPSALYGKSFGALSVFGGGSYRTTSRGLDPNVFDDVSHDHGTEQRAFLKLDYDQSDRTHFSALATFAHNFYQVPIDISVPQCNPSLADCGRVADQYGNLPAPFFPRDTNQTENERDFFALLSLRHDEGPRSSFRTALTYRHSYGFLFADALHALGPTADPCSSDDQGNVTCSSTSDVARTADHVGINAEQLWRAGENNLIKLGTQIDQLFGATDYTSYTRSDALQGPNPSLTTRGSDDSRSTTGGVYLQDRATFGRLVLDAGVRVDFQRTTFVDSPDRSVESGIGPRIGVAYTVNRGTVAHAYFGLLWQPPPVLDAAGAARILGVVPPGQPIAYDLVPEKDRYAEVGVESRVLPMLSVKLTAWGRLATDQLDDVGVGSTNLVSPYNFRQGRAGGIEVGSTLVLGSHLNAFGNASLEQAQGRGIETARYLFGPDDLANNDWQTLDHVQTWTANAGATLKDGHSTLSGLLEYGSGLRTGGNNDQHVPGHLRVDATLAHQFADAPARPTVAFDVFNVFDARYAYRIANGFNGSHFAPGRSIYLRLIAEY